MVEFKRNSIQYEVRGRYALFSDVVTRVGGEKFSYQVPTYQSLKGITESIYWKPSLVWKIDAVRIMNKIQTESKGIRTRAYKTEGKNKINDLSYYTYLTDVRYQVLAHFEWNEQRPELKDDWLENKHHNIALRSLEKGGRRDIFLGTRECQGYVEPCDFGKQDGFYDTYGQMGLGYMFYGFSYPDENPEHNLVVKFWDCSMKDGVIEFPDSSSSTLQSRVLRSQKNISVKSFELGRNFKAVGGEKQ